MENLSAIKRKGGLLPATTWVNLEDTVLRERCQSQNYILRDSTDTNGPGVTPTETESWWTGHRGWLWVGGTVM